MLRAVVTLGLLAALSDAFAPSCAPLAGARMGAVSQRPVQLRSAVSSAASMRAPLAAKSSFVGGPVQMRVTNEREMNRAVQQISMALADGQKPVIIGLAADSGCGKSTFMRRVTACFGGECKLNPIGRETNTLISDMTTVICLDDYHANDRNGRKESGLTALHPKENNFDLMYEQAKALKNGEKVSKPIYNHVNGTLDEPEEITPTPIIILEGLHPFYDSRVEELIDFKIYVDITPDVKFNWKVQRDHEERGHSIESIKQSIEARKPDFDAYIDPQKEKADCILEVLPTDLAEGDKKTLKVNMVQVKDVEHYQPTYLWDEGSEIEWFPAEDKLTRSAPGVKLFQKNTKWAGKDAAVVGIDGSFDKLDEMVYVEKQMSGTGSKFFGEITQKMLEYDGQPGSNDGTGLFQTVVACKVREIYESISKVTVPAEAKK